jgi:hypothetical protein
VFAAAPPDAVPPGCGDVDFSKIDADPCQARGKLAREDAQALIAWQIASVAGAWFIV